MQVVLQSSACVYTVNYFIHTNKHPAFLPQAGLLLTGNKLSLNILLHDGNVTETYIHGEKVV